MECRNINHDMECRNINHDMESVEISLSVAEKNISEGNAELSETLQESTLNRKKIMYCQKKIEMGLKRKKELKDESE